MNTQVDKAKGNMTSLSVLTYNVHLFEGSFVSKFKKSLTFHDKRRADTIISKIIELSPDCICLTEVWTTTAREWFYKGLGKIYPHSIIDNAGMMSQGSGLLFLSKHNIDRRKSKFIEFNQASGEDGLAQKGFIAAEIAAGNRKKITLVTTHLNADASLFTSQEANVEARIQQLKQIEIFLQPVVDKQPVIICGDLNVIGDSPEYHDMIAKFNGFQDEWVESGHAVDSGATYLPKDNLLIHYFDPKTKNSDSERLDYLLANDRFKNVSVSVLSGWTTDIDGVTYDASDHLPLYGQFSY